MKWKLVFVPVLLAFASSAASAATFVVNHEYDPANLLPGNITGETLATPIVLGVGDTLDLTLTFSGGSTIFANGEDGFWPLLLTDGVGAALQTTGTLEFLGASANVVSGPIALAQNNSSVHLGSFYSSSLYRLDNSPISFTSLRQIITINSDDIGASREYQRVALTFFQGSVTSVPGNVNGAVPEPSVWAMMLLGFAVIGFSVRRHKKGSARARYAF